MASCVAKLPQTVNLQKLWQPLLFLLFSIDLADMTPVLTPTTKHASGNSTGALNFHRKEGGKKRLLLLSSLEFQTRVLSRQRAGTPGLVQICADRTGTGQGTQAQKERTMSRRSRVNVMKLSGF
ncbi:hypothetical protein OJAV_G00006290 [Oryzias javanicus]|uniref:Secreted protein n=1 Tax=Oryzias javanicus TaxID=123683 RepID=A0A437DN04_ORYJA|nr:hypothetical protein OJAV_G00006290 [Oryzias javanicus]